MAVSAVKSSSRYAKGYSAGRGPGGTVNWGSGADEVMDELGVGEVTDKGVGLCYLVVGGAPGQGGGVEGTGVGGRRNCPPKSY